MARTPHILIADDDAAVREIWSGIATELGCRVTAAADGRGALLALAQHRPDVMVTDIRLSHGKGLELLRCCKQLLPATPVLITTAYATVDGAVEAMKQGASEYVAKPFEIEAMRRLLQGCLRQTQFASGMLIGASPAMQRVFRLIDKVAPSRYAVLMLGESGTGKEVVARALHDAGPERDRPFLPVDCGALVPSRIESELFGHVKGAFTGAGHAHVGWLEAAKGGTVFLDEIAELPLELQGKLLRAIQDKEIRPVGGTRRVRIEVRIVAATCRDLRAAVANGAFRKDLFFRLNVISIKLPPLRERVMDIPLLIEHFLDRATHLGQPGQPARGFTEAALARLYSYSWPGNVRELENCVEHALAMAIGPQLEIQDLPTQLRQAREFAAAAATGTGAVRAIADLEREAILEAVSQLQGDKLLAAKLLGIGKTTLYRKLKNYSCSAAPGAGR